MSGTMKHLEDDGDLSIVATDNSILVACNRGHFWQLEVSVQAAPGRGDRTRDLDDGVSASEPEVPAPAGPVPELVESWLDSATHDG